MLITSNSNNVWKSLREFVLERDNYTCRDCCLCLMPFALHAHHVKEQWDGGADTPDNLIALCPACHRKRHLKTMALWEKKHKRTKGQK